jgi:hypothetical protein
MEVADEWIRRFFDKQILRRVTMRPCSCIGRRSDPDRSRREDKIDSTDHKFIPSIRLKISNDRGEFSVSRSS